jgi:hypothetical protein
MKGPGILTMLMVMSVAIFAYAHASPAIGSRQSAGLFRSKTTCPAGMRHSSFYNECVRSALHTASR